MFTDSNQLHGFLKDNRSLLISRSQKRTDFAKMIRSLKSKTRDELIELSFSEEWKSAAKSCNYDHYLPLHEVLYSKYKNRISSDDEIRLVFDCRKYIWDCKPNRVFQMLMEIGISLEEAIDKIRNQLIEGGDLTMTMARSQDASTLEMQQSVDEFAIAKEKHKREKFIAELQKLSS